VWVTKAATETRVNDLNATQHEVKLCKIALSSVTRYVSSAYECATENVSDPHASTAMKALR
jgi:hypothetical protein